MLSLGNSCSDSTLPVLDHVVTGPALSLRSFCYLGLVLLVLDSARTESSTSIHGFARLEFMLLAIGLNRFGFVFLLLVIDYTHLGPFLLTHSFV